MGEKKSLFWSRELTANIINEYEKYPCLYKTNIPEYKLKTKRYEALKNILESISENGQNITIEDINKKIHGLRTQFFKEHNRYKSSLTSGAGTQDIYEPKLWCYQLLKFLVDTDPVRQSLSNLEYNQENTQEIFETETPPEMQTEDILIYDGPVEEVDSICVDESPIDSNKKPKVSRKRKNDDVIANMIQEATNVLRDTVDGNKDDISLFGRSMIVELRKIKNAVRLRNIKRGILDMILTAQDEEDDI